MAAVRRLEVFFCTLLIVIVTLVQSTTEIAYSRDPDFSVQIELDQIKSSISFLESTIDERTHELRTKDVLILQMEKNIKDKSNVIASLQFEIESLRRQSSLNLKYEAVTAHVRAGELENQVATMRKEIKLHSKKTDALETHANVAEKKIQMLTSNQDRLQKINDEQMIRIHKAELALQLAEEEIKKSKLEATQLSEELKEVHGAWFPPWARVRLGDLKFYILTHWYSRGRPTFDWIIQESLKNGIPMLKEWWLAFVTYLAPHVRTLTTRSIEVYDLYFQEAKKFTESYRPHFTAFNPYTKILFHSYKKLIKTAAVYHRQVQASVLELLKSYELTEPFATNELAWFAASSLFALPVIYLFKLPSAIFGKEPNRRSKHSHERQTRRRVKRTHQEW